MTLLCHATPHPFQPFAVKVQSRYHANVICCQRPMDDEIDDKILADVHALPAAAQRVVNSLIRAIAPKVRLPTLPNV